MDNLKPPICSVCHQPLLPAYYFCPNCGHEVKEKPLHLSVWTQIGVYLLSIALPPLGLWPGIKYLAKPGRQAKWVGAIAIALTLISTVASIWLIFAGFKAYLNQINGLNGFGL